MDEQEVLNLLINTLKFDWGTALSLVNDTILLYLVFRFYSSNKDLKKRVELLEQKISSEKKTEKLDKITTPEEQKVVPIHKEVLEKKEVVKEEPKVEISIKANPFIAGLKKTRDSFFSKLNSIIGSTNTLEEKTYADLEELLITSDLGVRTTQSLLGKLKEKQKNNSTDFDLKTNLKGLLSDILQTANANSEIKPEKINKLPFVILVVGVNGVGKTTTIGKLASRFANSGLKVLLGAADTFRAAAVEQIEVWAERANVELHTGQEGAKPSTVAYEALKKAQDNDFDVVIIDTAGRLHTKTNLMNELSSVLAVIEKLQAGAPHETILVVDAATGQNALEQAREFNQKTKLSGIVLTKLDGTPKGGIVFAIKNELGIPIRYVGVGEGVEDLRPFNSDDFINALFEEESNFIATQGKSELRVVRRRENNS